MAMAMAMALVQGIIDQSDCLYGHYSHSSDSPVQFSPVQKASLGLKIHAPAVYTVPGSGQKRTSEVTRILPYAMPACLSVGLFLSDVTTYHDE